MKNLNSGQALVVLLFYMIIAITLTTASIAVVLANSLSSTRTQQSIHALETAEAGAENAIIRLIRNPSYTGETLTINDGNATVSVSGSSPKLIRSVGQVGAFSRTIHVEVSVNGGVVLVTSWQEQ